MLSEARIRRFFNIISCLPARPGFEFSFAHESSRRNRTAYQLLGTEQSQGGFALYGVIEMSSAQSKLIVKPHAKSNT